MAAPENGFGFLRTGMIPELRRQRWKTQLEPVAEFVDIFVIPPVKCVNYTTGRLYPAKDLEDLCHIDYDAGSKIGFWMASSILIHLSQRS
jgi:hypothetical protein